MTLDFEGAVPDAPGSAYTTQTHPALGRPATQCSSELDEGRVWRNRERHFRRGQ